MEPINEAEARRVLHSDEDDVVQPWEERAEVIEAGLDDNTAPPPDGGAVSSEPGDVPSR